MVHHLLADFCTDAGVPERVIYRQSADGKYDDFEIDFTPFAF